MLVSNARVCTITLTFLACIWSCDCGDSSAVSVDTGDDKNECPTPTNDGPITCSNTTNTCGPDTPCRARFRCCFDGCVNFCVRAKLLPRHGHHSEPVSYSQKPPLHNPASITVAMGTFLLTDVFRRHFV